MIYLFIVYLIMGIGVLSLMIASDFELVNVLSLILPVLFWPLILIAFALIFLKGIHYGITKEKSQK